MRSISIRRSAGNLLAACTLVMLTAPVPADAHAHPADMYAQNLSISLRSEELQLDWQILPGPFLADAVWVAADLDQSGSVSPSEAEAWVAPFISSLSVRMDDQPLMHDALQALHWPSTVDVMRTAEDRIRFSLHFAWPENLRGAHGLEIQASHLEANSLNWFALEA